MRAIQNEVGAERIARTIGVCMIATMAVPIWRRREAMNRREAHIRCGNARITIDMTV
ncbi:MULTISPECIES: hypothetical protein [Lysobacter]|jgi:hypothetical protein|uniref:hypothetical protein n=1 Tax=Lysobacter TaxID=68 RepID=UPI001F3893C7|nr:MULTISPECIES: hypothetical protein [Lysobacter]UJB21692.1 hypothetical protein L1A79_11835 [Lysobacter capsici]UJQ29191.1 hypothetical protein L2D09_03030 [Lysobacter gummosus]